MNFLLEGCLSAKNRTTIVFSEKRTFIADTWHQRETFLYAKQGSYLGHLKHKASWATYINLLALTWDHHIPHSFGDS